MGFLPLVGIKGRSVMLGILVMLLGSNFHKPVSVLLSPAARWRSGAECLCRCSGVLTSQGDCGQSNQCT